MAAPYILSGLIIQRDFFSTQCKIYKLLDALTSFLKITDILNSTDMLALFYSPFEKLPIYY